MKQITMDCSSAQSDIATYVEGIVQEKLKIEELIVGDPGLIEDIKVALSDGANGMFLWVVFQVDELCLQHCDEDIRTAIRNFPKDLEETFNRVIDRIISQRNEDIAKRIFRWVAAAKEPLSLKQLEEIIFVEIGQEYSKRERQSNGIVHISSWCENLVHVDEELKTVQFVHQTVQQFFIERSSKSRNNQFSLNLRDADHFLGEICVTYLNFNDFKTTLARKQQPLPPMPPIAIAGTALRPKWKAVPSIPTLLKLNPNTRGGLTASNAIEALSSFQQDDTGDANERLLVRHPFLGYASIHWIYHTTMFQKGKSRTWDLWEKMIVQGNDLVKKPWIERSFSEIIGMILDWSQKFHHYALVRLILLHGMLSSSDRKRLLQNAAIQEDIMLLDILLEHQAPGVMIDEACKKAVQFGRLHALERLLTAGADGQAALQAAALSGQQNAIARLLSAGIDGQIALQAIARSENVFAATSLLDAGVDGQLVLQHLIKSIQFDGVSPWSSQNLPYIPSKPIRTLLAAGVDGQPMLQTAAKRGYQRTIVLLLAAGADGQPALLAACKINNQDIMKLLLSTGVDDQTALQTAAREGHQNIMKSLLAAGADGRTALISAAKYDDPDMIKSLLAAGVDGQEALQTAIQKGDLHIIKSLLAAGVDGQTPLQTAAKGGNRSIIECLLAAGVDAIDLQSALYTACRSEAGASAASEGGHLDVVERLLAAGSQVNAYHTWNGQSALGAASGRGHLDVVERLLAAGAKVNTYDTSKHPTALQAACQGADVEENGVPGNVLQAASEGGRLDVLEAFFAAGFEVNAPKNRQIGRIALQAASRGGHLKVVERLLAAGADVNVPAGSKAPTALQLAAKGGHMRIVLRLKQASAKE
ncbi:ankyrin repeat-containing domain protein [Trichoderma sp. SZMC 28015]